MTHVSIEDLLATLAESSRLLRVASSAQWNWHQDATLCMVKLDQLYTSLSGLESKT